MNKPKKTRKKIKLLSFTAFLFIFSASLYLASSLFLRTYNNSLSAKKQSVERQIAEVETQNSAVEVEIQTLSTRERVDNIASENGLSLNQDNIVTIAINDGD